MVAAVATTCRQASWALSTASAKVGGEQQVFELGVLVERLLDPIEEHGPDDAPATPQHGAVAVVERPVVLGGSGLQLHEALGVADDLRGVERLPDVLDELLCGRRRNGARGL